jgi:hypothetical protein
MIYPFKIIFPMNKVRVYYCRNRDERSKWLHHLKTAVGYSQIEDFYEIQVRSLGSSEYYRMILVKVNSDKSRWLSTSRPRAKSQLRLSRRNT